MDVGSEATEEEFHDWYSNEHIPLRTETFTTFRSAARYRAIDGLAPKFVAFYTVSDPETYNDPAYKALRDQRSAREADVMGRLACVDRRIYSLISDTTPLPEALKPTSIASGIAIFNSFTPPADGEEAFNDWYEKEYIPAVKQVPGFYRTRRFKLVDGGINGLKKDEFKKPPVYLELTEFELLSSLSDPKFPSDKAGEAIIGSAIASERRVFKLIKSFEPTAALKSLRTPGGGLMTPRTEETTRLGSA
ncbi:hypothetical protein DL93DRAFT_2086117 [Clavulina sp. PMI_390]|nr:hypothetical protein DL93DRAFT_2086117 [Clavulina sp. PMI_390]